METANDDARCNTLRIDSEQNSLLFDDFKERVGRAYKTKAVAYEMLRASVEEKTVEESLGSDWWHW